MRRRLPVVLLLALTVAGCGSERDASSTVGGTGQPSTHRDESGPEHIHGLGVSGDSLYIATHTGLWVAPAGQSMARPVGDSRQDIMGFSVLGDGRFIGSGHPAPGQELPPNLGLIESRDGGKTWKNVSLLGDADFHVLESAGQRVYGFDGTQARLLVSSDGGRSWAQRSPPAGMFSLAIDPRDAKRIITSTERGIFMSPSAGRAWRPLRDDTAGLMAWPVPDQLYLVDGDGHVEASADGGHTWRAVGTIGGQPAAFIAHGHDLYAALADATVKRSSDGGRSWTVRAVP
jgi:hypothetical protein